jgi:hypothetical protein
LGKQDGIIGDMNRKATTIGNTSGMRMPRPGERLQYAVLWHSGVDPEHFDLLLQLAGEDKLLTWRILTPMEQWAGGVTAERVADHRAVYMTYEGPISGGRGEVKRVATGAGECVAAGVGTLRVRLDGMGEVTLAC